MIYVMQIVNTHGIRGEVKALHFTDGEIFFKKVKKMQWAGWKYPAAFTAKHRGTCRLLPRLIWTR